MTIKQIIVIPFSSYLRILTENLLIQNRIGICMHINLKECFPTKAKIDTSLPFMLINTHAIRKKNKTPLMKNNVILKFHIYHTL